METMTELHGMRSILSTLMKDHDDLRTLIEVLKADNENITKKKKAYADFSELLKSHAKCEEKAVYEMGLKFKDLKMGTFEAYEEHAVAAELMKKLAKTKIKEQWLGRVKVLAEVVEHHIIEEETDYLLELKKKVKSKQELKMVEDFIRLREKSPHQPSTTHNGILTKVKAGPAALAQSTH